MLAWNHSEGKHTNARNLKIKEIPFSPKVLSDSQTISPKVRVNLTELETSGMICCAKYVMEMRKLSFIE